jgi:hypothetical protein
VEGKFGLMSIAIAIALGASLRRSPNRFLALSTTIKVTPVTLPPRLLRLATRPSSTGLPPPVNTIGIVVVAALAASLTLHPPVAAIAATRRPTNSAANAGSRSYRPSAQRYSMVTFLPSI